MLFSKSTVIRNPIFYIIHLYTHLSYRFFFEGSSFTINHIGQSETVEEWKSETPSVLSNKLTLAGWDKNVDRFLYISPSYTSRIVPEYGGILDRSSRSDHVSAPVGISCISKLYILYRVSYGGGGWLSPWDPLPALSKINSKHVALTVHTLHHFL